MWFTIRPDCYGSPECDQVEPRWHCYADGDKDADEQREPLSLDASRFPPGTKIVVHEPVCPKCGEAREPNYKDGEYLPGFVSKCRCGFDWDEWTLSQYG